MIGHRHKLDFTLAYSSSGGNSELSCNPHQDSETLPIFLVGRFQFRCQFVGAILRQKLDTLGHS